MSQTCRGSVLVLVMMLMSVVASIAGGQEVPGSVRVATGDNAAGNRRAADAVLDRRVTVNLKNMTLERALQSIAKQGQTIVTYDDRVIARYQRPITLHTKNMPLRDVFEKLFAGTPLQIFAQPHAGLVVLDGMATPYTDSTGTITGTVVDSATGGPIVGATVAIQGIKQSVITTNQGAFTLQDVPAGERTLVARVFGYRPITRMVTVRTGVSVTMRMSLASVPNMLSGVVTTATGEQQKLEVGNNIVTLNVDSIMQVAPIRSVVDVLEGRVPGMTVQRTSGTPGDPARIRLRGAGSITQNNDPIIVVDGIRMYGEQSNERNANVRTIGSDTSRYAKPSPLDQMDPNMIDKIEVLKGPSAASLYGSDAANGVIVITTKRGGSGVRWSLAADQGLSYMPGKWPVTQWPWGRSAISNAPMVCLPGDEVGCAVIDSLVPFQALNEPRYTVAGHGRNTGVTASLLGGRGDMQYAYTASMRNDLGILKLPVDEEERYQELTGKAAPDWMRRPEQLTSWSLSATNRMQLSDVASVSIMSMLNKSLQRRTGLSDSFNSAVAQLSKMWFDKTQRTDNFVTGKPYEQATSDQTNVTLGGQAQWQPVRWLSLIGAVGVNMLSHEDQILLRAQLDPLFLFSGVQPSGYLQATDGRALNQTATVNTTIPLLSRMALALGVNYQGQQTTDAQGFFAGFDKNVDDPSSGTVQDREHFGRTTSDRKSFGWFVEPQLSFESRFFVMPGIRLDNNGLSGKNAGLNSLPKMNLSWIASEEPFFPFKSVIDLFRVRTAFGVAGVQPTAQDRFRLLEEVSLNDNPDQTQYYGDMLKLAGLGNTRLRPERSGEWEGGFDSEMFGGRLKMDVTLYRKMRYDAIVGLPLASSLGPGEVMINLGIVRNQGSELGFNTQLLETKNLGWNVGVNLSTNNNKVLRLNGIDQTLGLLQGGGLAILAQQYRVGYPTNGAWTKPIQSFHDLDGDGLLTASEVLVGDSAVFMGPKEPTRTAGLQSNLAMFGGRLSVNVSFNYTGGSTQSDGIAASCASGYINNCSTAFAMMRFNKNASLEEQASAVALAAHRSAFGFMRPVSSWRFQTASLNVNMGQSVARLFRARSMNVALQGSNLGLWTNYRGKDPNVNGYVWGDNTADLGQLPSPRTWSLRIALGN